MESVPPPPQSFVLIFFADWRPGSREGRRGGWPGPLRESQGSHRGVVPLRASTVTGALVFTLLPVAEYFGIVVVIVVAGVAVVVVVVDVARATRAIDWSATAPAHVHAVEHDCTNSG